MLGWIIELKRVIDFIVSLAFLVLAAPLFLFLIVLIRLRLGSPIFFRQQRPGLNGKIFTLIKFRTMRDAYDAAGNPTPDEQRVSGFGNLLRKTSLDELPELINILAGDMSFVGPRPLLVEYLPLYNEHQARRHKVRPGLTGWAVVNGRNQLSWEEKFDLDVWYVDNRSLWLDLKILLMTAKTLLRARDVYSKSDGFVQPFQGSNR